MEPEQRSHNSKLHFAKRPTHRVLALEWSQDQWERWLDELTPRQLVLQMTGWEVLRRSVPTLSEDFGRIVVLARSHLLAREAVSG
jgi:hypothetical protein